MTEVKKNALMPHSYDGIQEYNNRIPLWLNLIFYFSILFALGYFPYYHFFGGTLPSEEYKEEMAAVLIQQQTAAAQAATVDLNTLAADPNAIADGQLVFNQNCFPCHGLDAKGKEGQLGVAAIGPNLTDKEWIHGGTMTMIVKTIAEGVLPKGMPSWEPILGTEKVHRAAAYIFSLGGGVKEGEGSAGYGRLVTEN